MDWSHSQFRLQIVHLTISTNQQQNNIKTNNRQSSVEKGFEAPNKTMAHRCCSCHKISSKDIKKGLGRFFDICLGLFEILMAFMPVIIVLFLVLSGMDLFKDIQRVVKATQLAYQSDVELIANETAPFRQELQDIAKNVTKEFETLDAAINKTIVEIKKEEQAIANEISHDLRTIESSTKGIRDFFGAIGHDFEKVESTLAKIPTKIKIPDINIKILGKHIHIPFPSISIPGIKPVVDMLTHNALTSGIGDLKIALKTVESTIAGLTTNVFGDLKNVTMTDVRLVSNELGTMTQSLKLAAHVCFHEIKQVGILIDNLEKNTAQVFQTEEYSVTFAIYLLVALVLTIFYICYIYVVYYVLAPVNSGLHLIFGASLSKRRKNAKTSDEHAITEV